MRFVWKLEYVVQPNQINASKLKMVKYVTKATSTAATAKGVRFEGSVMFEIAQSA